MLHLVAQKLRLSPCELATKPQIVARVSKPKGGTMPKQAHSTVLFAAAAVALGALAACERNDMNANRTDSAALRMDSASGTLMDEHAWTRDSMRTDGTIMGWLHEANEAVIVAGDVAKDRASDSVVRTFANQMVMDHKRLDDRGDSLARTLDIDIVEPHDVVEDAFDRGVDSLKKIDRDSATMAFDRAYIAQQVSAHTQVLAMVDSAIARAQNEQFKAALQKDVRPAVAGHLQRAEAIQRRLGTGGRGPIH
jgi:putative membrane protein